MHLARWEDRLEESDCSQRVLDRFVVAISHELQDEMNLLEEHQWPLIGFDVLGRVRCHAAALSLAKERGLFLDADAPQWMGHIDGSLSSLNAAAQKVLTESACVIWQM